MMLAYPTREMAMDAIAKQKQDGKTPVELLRVRVVAAKNGRAFCQDCGACVKAVPMGKYFDWVHAGDTDESRDNLLPGVPVELDARMFQLPRKRTGTLFDYMKRGDA